MSPYQPKPISLDSQVILRSDIGLGEAYMDGDYEVYGSFRSDGTKEVRRAPHASRRSGLSALCEPRRPARPVPTLTRLASPAAAQHLSDGLYSFLEILSRAGANPPQAKTSLGVVGGWLHGMS